MSKLLLSIALAGTFVVAMAHPAAARSRHYRRWAPVYQYQYQYVAPAAPAATAPAVSPPPVVAAQPRAGYMYRSFSYDPGEARVYPPPPSAGRRLYPYEPPFFRADHKMLGTSYTD